MIRDVESSIVGAAVLEVDEGHAGELCRLRTIVGAGVGNPVVQEDVARQQVVVTENHVRCEGSGRVERRGGLAGTCESLARGAAAVARAPLSRPCLAPLEQTLHPAASGYRWDFTQTGMQRCEST